jgi:surface polysaccharide O-acyltransferase-like enzyme
MVLAREIEYLRGFAILAVIGVHVFCVWGAIPSITPIFITDVFFHVFTIFSVPLFVFISGLVLSMKYFPTFSITDFFTRRVLVILPPYIVFSLAYSYIYAKPDPLENLFMFNAQFHLWFIKPLLVLYALYPILIWIYQRIPLKSFLIISFLIQVTFKSFVYTGDLLDRLVFLALLFYFALGIYIGRNYVTTQEILHRHSLKPMVWSIMIITILTTIVWIARSKQIPSILYAHQSLADVINYSILEPVLYILIFCALIKVSYRLTNVVIQQALFSLGQLSFGIYLIHIFPLEISRSMLNGAGFDINNPVYYIINYISTLILSFLGIYLLCKLPKMSILVGGRLRRSPRERYLVVPKEIDEPIDKFGGNKGVNPHPFSLMHNRTTLTTLASFFCSVFMIALVTSVGIDPYINVPSFGDNLFNRYEEYLASDSPIVTMDNKSVVGDWVKGGDNSLWVNVDGIWYGKGGYLTSDPFAAKDYNGKLHVLVRGGDNGAWDFIYDPNTAIGHWYNLGGYIIESLTAAQDPINHSVLRVAARGTDNALWTCDLDINTETSAWTPQGGVLTSRPSIMFDSSNTEHIIVRGGDNELWDKQGVWTGSTYKRTWCHVSESNLMFVLLKRSLSKVVTTLGHF